MRSAQREEMHLSHQLSGSCGETEAETEARLGNVRLSRTIRNSLLLEQGRTDAENTCKKQCCRYANLKITPSVSNYVNFPACERYSKGYTIDLKPFIIKGENVSLGEFPYMVKRLNYVLSF